MYRAGDCIFIDTNYYKDGTTKAHLFVVILDAELESDKTILVPMSTILDAGWYDCTTVLKDGDHEFVSKPTFIDYREANIKTKSWMDKNGRKDLSPVSPDLLQIIADGIKKSEHVPNDVYEHYIYRNL